MNGSRHSGEEKLSFRPHIQEFACRVIHIEIASFKNRGSFSEVLSIIQCTAYEAVLEEIFYSLYICMLRQASLTTNEPFES